RNELIARYIRAPHRQDSRHAKAVCPVTSRCWPGAELKRCQSNIRDPATKERAMQTLSQLFSAGLAPASTRGQQQQQQHSARASINNSIVSESLEPDSPVSIAGPRLRLRELIAFVEAPALADSGRSSDQQQQHSSVGFARPRRHLFASLTAASADAAPPPLECVDVSQIADKFPERRGGLRDFLERGRAYLVKCSGRHINTPIPDEAGAFYGFGTNVRKYRASNAFPAPQLKCASFGRQVVEKVEKHIGPRLESGRYVYQSDRSPMCEYMLPEKYMMNTVLENFTILQKHSVPQDAPDFEYLIFLAVPNRPPPARSATAVKVSLSRIIEDVTTRAGRGSGRDAAAAAAGGDCVLGDAAEAGQSRASRLAPGAGPGRRAAIPRSRAHRPFRERLKALDERNGRLANHPSTSAPKVRAKRAKNWFRRWRSGAGSGAGARPGGAAAAGGGGDCAGRYCWLLVARLSRQQQMLVVSPEGRQQMLVPPLVVSNRC
uniref:YBD domain-containing protein n=1 Tax=Macrostomum lignano TaxID=282301 RepID=A0A1I8FJ72_9PLAT